MAALQYFDTPGYHAILLRRTFKALTMPEALLDRADTWLTGTGAKWKDSESAWISPEGASLSFGYLENDRDVEQYQSAAFQFIGFDELTQFLEKQYQYMFSRLRRLTGLNVPVRVRWASNPGSIGHEWVKQRFIVEGQKFNRPFIPAKLSDNPALDQATYIKSLMNLDSITRAQLLNGDWSAVQAGGKFRREWFNVPVEAMPADCKRVRFWDLAATEAKKGNDPDYTAGALMGRSAQGIYFIADIRRMRGTPLAVEALIKQTAHLDGKAVTIYIEQEPGSSGVNTIDHYRREVLAGFTFYGVKSTGSKEERANPVSSQAEAGNIKLVRGTWINDFLDEAEAFPGGAHDDQVDAISGAFAELTGNSFDDWSDALEKANKGNKE
jgi:predicted phage terminase large subunit-like protein